jgi:hypothetical protein
MVQGREDGYRLVRDAAPGVGSQALGPANVEQVVVPNIAAGIATITVRAFRNVSPQTFALVVRVS